MNEWGPNGGWMVSLVVRVCDWNVQGLRSQSVINNTHNTFVNLCSSPNTIVRLLLKASIFWNFWHSCL